MSEGTSDLLHSVQPGIQDTTDKNQVWKLFEVEYLKIKGNSAKVENSAADEG